MKAIKRASPAGVADQVQRTNGGVGTGDVLPRTGAYLNMQPELFVGRGRQVEIRDDRMLPDRESPSLGLVVGVPEPDPNPPTVALFNLLEGVLPIVACRNVKYSRVVAGIIRRP
jgi:hypothetical protein